MVCLDLLIGPFDPRQQRRDVVGFNRRSAPDAKTWRGIAIAIEIIADATLFEHRDDLLRHCGLISSGQAIIPVALKHHADPGIRALVRIRDHIAHPWCRFDPLMDNGRIVESGRHQELLDQGGAYAQLYQMQFSEHA